MAMSKERFLELQSKRQSSMLAKSGFRLILTPHFDKSSAMTDAELAQIDRDNEPIEFDIVTDHSVTASSTVTSYPLVNGDTVADHMIRQPVSMSINGTFSLNGSKPSSFDGNEDRLTNIEAFFEKMKDNGVLCDIVTMERSSSDSSKRRFKSRSNMAISSITWNEGQNSLSFSMSLIEALIADLDDISIDYYDENLPSIVDAASSNFTDELLDWKAVDDIIIQQLQEAGLIEHDFLEDAAYWAKTIGKTYLDASIAGTITGIGAAAVVAALVVPTAVAMSVPMIGWALVTTAAVVGAIVGAVWSLVSSISRINAEREYAVETFKHYEEDEKAKQETVRFCNYIGSIHKQLSSLNDAISVFGINSSQEQECMLYIDDDYYTFRFTKNNTQTKGSKTVWSCSYSNVDESIKADMADVAASSFSNVGDCKSDNFLFRTNGDGSYVYLINKSLYAVEHGSYDNEEARQKAIDACNSDLTNFCVMVSKINMDDFNSKLADVVVNAMRR